jgi:hypothetical protein
MSSNTIILGGGYLFDYDPFWSSVVALCHFDGTNGSRVFTEEKGHAMYYAGNAALSANQSLYGDTSAYLAGSGDYFAISASNNGNGSDFSLASDDFTLEIAYRHAPNTWGKIVGNYQWQAGYRGGWYLGAGTDGSLAFVTSTTLVSGGAGTIKDGQWNRIAVVRRGTTFYLYVEGVLVAQAVPAAPTQNIPDPGTAWAKNLRFGCKITDGASFDDFLPGYYDEFRLTRGVARYLGNSYSLAAAGFPNK